MATKYQDSTPKHVFWNPNKTNPLVQVTTWGYNSVLVGFKVPEGITGGIISFEGYLGMKPLEDPEAEWGDWYTLAAKAVKLGDNSDPYHSYDLSSGSNAFRVNVMGFSQFRVGLLKPLEGDGEVQVAYACHAVA